jgi:hypothetical protein
MQKLIEVIEAESEPLPEMMEHYILIQCYNGLAWYTCSDTARTVADLLEKNNTWLKSVIEDGQRSASDFRIVKVMLPTIMGVSDA